MSTYENEGIPRNGGGIAADSLSCLRPQEIMKPTINAEGMNTQITRTYVGNIYLLCIVYAPDI